MMLTPRQREIADLLLVGAERKRVIYTLGISDETLRAHLVDMRRRLDADSHDAMMKRLRVLMRNPIEIMREVCRAEPRQWWMV